MLKTTEQMKRFNFLLGETDAEYHAMALKLGLSDSAMRVLYAVCNFGESCLLTDICKLSGISKQTINSALRKLEADGYIELKVQSGLKKTVMLTPSGKVLAERTAGKIIQIENDIFASWPDEDREKYLELAARYLSDLRERVKKEIR